jgi:Protein of unknown function (DUF1186)/SEC-C motif
MPCFLLAQFRETRAYPLVVRFALLPGDLAYSLSGDFVTDDLSRVLASVCGGELEAIQSLIENEDADEWARGAGLNSLVNLVTAGQKSREEIVDYFALLFRGKLAREYSHVWNSLVSCCVRIYPDGLLDDIEQACEEDLVDSSCVSLDDAKHSLAMGKDRVLASLADEPYSPLIEDAVKEMDWWSCFRDASAKGASQPQASPLASAPAAQIKHTKPKTGRNEPCPCGSGRKYKKCCGA